MMEVWREKLYANELYHYGVKGMKWRRRKTRRKSPLIADERLGARDYHRYAERRNRYDDKASGVNNGKTHNIAKAGKPRNTKKAGKQKSIQRGRDFVSRMFKTTE